MPRRPNFRSQGSPNEYYQSELKRLNKLVQNKQSRIRTRKGVETIGIETKKISDIPSLKEFDRYFKEMNQFLERKANFKVQTSKGVELDYSDLHEYEKTIKRVNRAKEREWNRIKGEPFRHRGIDTGLTVEQVADPVFGIGDPRFSEYEKLRYNPDRWRSKQEFERDLAKRKDLYKGDWLKRKNLIYKQHYLDSFERKIGLRSPKATALFQTIQEMDIDEFIKVFRTENNAHIDFIYDDLEIEGKIQELERIWN